MTSEDLALVKEFLASGEAVRKGLDILNTRAFKVNDSEFLITVGSASADGSCNMTYQEKTFRVEFGEFSEYCADMNAYLAKALPYGTVNVTVKKGGLEIPADDGKDAIVIANAGIIVRLAD